ncbi:MAG: hypothetical protein AAGE52_38460 [Myxococcota bacterium]
MTDLSAQIRIRLRDEVSRAVGRISSSLRGLGAAGSTSSQTAARGASELEQATRRAAAATETAAASAQQQAAASSQSAASSQRSASASDSDAAAKTRQAQAERAAAAASRQATKDRQRASLGVAQNINLASELALSFGSLSPVTQQLGLQFATAGNNAFALARSLTPAGVIVGTLIGTLPGLISLFRNLGDSAETSAGQVNAFQEALNRAREARVEREAREEAISGEASTGEIQDRIAATRDQRKEDEEQLRRLRRSLGSTFGIDADNPLVRGLLGNAATEGLQRGTVGDLEAAARAAVPFTAGLNQDRVTEAFREVGAQGQSRLAQDITGSREEQGLLEGGLRIASARERAETFESDAQISERRLERLLRDSGLSPGDAADLQDELLDPEAFDQRDQRIRLTGEARRSLGRIDESVRADIERAALDAATQRNAAQSERVLSDQLGEAAAASARRAGAADEDQAVGFSGPSGSRSSTESRLIRAESADPTVAADIARAAESLERIASRPAPTVTVRDESSALLDFDTDSGAFE